MIDGVLLKDIRHESFSSSICAWDYLPIPESETRLFFKPSEESGMGFHFYAVERMAFYDDKWDANNDVVECVVQGTAYFDGIRHLYYGDEQTDNYGYHYCANLEMIINTLATLKILEKTFCRDCR